MKHPPPPHPPPPPPPLAPIAMDRRARFPTLCWRSSTDASLTCSRRTCLPPRDLHRLWPRVSSSRHLFRQTTKTTKTWVKWTVLIFFYIFSDCSVFQYPSTACSFLTIQLLKMVKKNHVFLYGNVFNTNWNCLLLSFVFLVLFLILLF